MTTSFFSADTEYAETLHEAETARRDDLDLDVDATEPVPSDRQRPSVAGWVVSVTAALIGITTFSITAAYAIDGFTTSPAPISRSTTAPDVVMVQPAPPSPVPSRAPEVDTPVELPHVVVVAPPHRSAPPVSSIAPAPAPPPAPVTEPAPVPPPPNWHPPVPPVVTLCHFIKCSPHDHSHHDSDDSDDPQP
jgi:hypothetical protein